jgi:hypothetical protein
MIQQDKNDKQDKRTGGVPPSTKELSSPTVDRTGQSQKKELSKTNLWGWIQGAAVKASRRKAREGEREKGREERRRVKE